jgi:iron complex outermembrane recepter protein
MRSRRFLFRYVVGLLFAFAPLAHAQAPAPLSGRVVAEETGQPIDGAHLQLEGTELSAVSGADGTFVIRDVPRAGYTLIVSRDGYETIRTRVDLGAGSRPQLEIRLPFTLAFREDIVVGGRTVGELGLAGQSTTGSRLGLNAIDIPASIDVLDSTVMEARGYQKVSDAVASMAGVVAGEHPTAPSTFSVRGFTANQVATLRDGIWLGPSTMVMRPQNTFNLDRVELLRGPSSVVNGQGAVAGTINAVTKSAEPTTATAWHGLVSYGRFDTYHTAGGVTGPVTDSLWYRVDASRSGSSGYVDRMDAGSSNVTASMLWRPARRTRLKFSADYLDDDLAKYFGTPLVPRSAAVEPLDVIDTTTGETIDATTRFVNYNVSDGYARSRQVLLRTDASIDLTDRLSLNNVLYGFDADRRWKNAEGYVYCTSIVDVCTTVGDIQRYYGYFLINHDQRLVGDRLTLNLNSSIAGREHRAVAGAEVSTLDFERTRGFRRRVPPAQGDAVSLLSPVPGLYGPEELRGISPTAIDTWAVFVEDSLAATPRLRVTGALRFDGLDLDRQNLSPERVVEAGGFRRQFNWWSWRAGAVYEITRGVVGYGQYSNAKDPVSSNIFLVNANQNFDLTQATQWEAGVKADVRGGRTQVTAAYFDIDRDDVLERFALDSATNIGGLSTHGAELAGTFRVDDRSRVGANLGVLSSSFRPSPNFVRLAGNRPPNVPRVTANVWASRQDIAGVPIEVGGSARFVGDRFANNANTIAMKGYALADVYAAWTRNRVRVTARMDNLTNAAYASWSDVFYLGQNDPSFLYANELMLGPPRTFSLMLQLGL